MLELEGTWEEIAAHAAELAGRRVRLTVLDGTEKGQEEETMLAVERFRDAMREAEGLEMETPLTPVPNSVALVREARAGATGELEPSGSAPITPGGADARAGDRDPELVARVRSLRGKFARPGGEWASELLQRERQADKEKEEPSLRNRP